MVDPGARGTLAIGLFSTMMQGRDQRVREHAEHHGAPRGGGLRHPVHLGPGAGVIRPAVALAEAGHPLHHAGRALRSTPASANSSASGA
jgi:hypothetical protein